MQPFIQKVVRCLHCQHYGHSIRSCRNFKKQIICSKCAEKGHSVDECDSDYTCCINCIRANIFDKTKTHRADDVKYPIYKEQRKVKKIMAAFCLSATEANMILKDKRPIPLRSDFLGTSKLPLPTLEDFLPKK